VKADAYRGSFSSGFLLLDPSSIARWGYSRCRQKGGRCRYCSCIGRAGANINESDAVAPALYYAVSGAQLEAAKLLIERGADVNALSTFGVGPLGPAVGKRNVELIKLLLDHGANPNSTIGTETVLHYAAEDGCLDCIKALVEAGADVNAVTSNGQYRTPLHIAKRRGFKEMADYLLAHGVILPKTYIHISEVRGSRRPEGSNGF
jgi:ankyrin repeat protein